MSENTYSAWSVTDRGHHKISVVSGNEGDIESGFYVEVRVRPNQFVTYAGDRDNPAKWMGSFSVSKHGGLENVLPVVVGDIEELFDACGEQAWYGYLRKAHAKACEDARK